MIEQDDPARTYIGFFDPKQPISDLQGNLAQPAIRKIVADALPFFENTRYVLREWVIMPNHVHVIVTPRPEYDLSKIIHSWKSYTANEINKKLGQSGTLWQKEPFDHIIRGPDQLERFENYVHDNPRYLHESQFTRHCLHK